jgi:phosphoribosylformylglycinamidine synthase
LGGSSFNQTQNKIGNETPNYKMLLSSKAFNTLQDLIKEEKSKRVMILEVVV